MANSTRMQVRLPSVKVQLLASGSDGGFGAGVGDGLTVVVVVTGAVVVGALVVVGADVVVVVVVGGVEELLVD